MGPLPSGTGLRPAGALAQGQFICPEHVRSLRDPGVLCAPGGRPGRTQFVVTRRGLGYLFNI